MPHNSRQKHHSDESKSQQVSLGDSDNRVGHAASTDHEAHEGASFPFYDDPNHIAYGWQQMAALPDFPDLHTLVRGTEDDPPLSPGSRSQSWRVVQKEPAKPEQSGFNPNPRRGLGPRRPPLLTDASVRSLYHRRGADRTGLKPFVDSVFTETENKCHSDDITQGRPQPRALVLKDTNQKLKNDHNEKSVSPYLKPAGNSRKQCEQAWSRKLIIDELEISQHADSRMERVPALPEEPAPLRIRETHSRSKTIEQARLLPAEQINEKVMSSELNRRSAEVKVTVREGGGTQEVMECLTSAMRDWRLTTFAEPPPSYGFEHRSAVPRPLNLAAIMAAKEQKAERPRPENDRSGSITAQAAKDGSVESSATGTSSDIEKMSIPEGDEHNGSRQKWYKGFRRSG